MQYLSQFLWILLFSFVGELLHVLLPLPIPASIYGLVLLFLSLQTGILRLKQVEKAGNFLIGLMPLLFVAPVVNILGCWDVIRDNLIPIAIVIAVSTVIVFGLSGRITQRLLDRKKGDIDG